MAVVVWRYLWLLVVAASLLYAGVNGEAGNGEEEVDSKEFDASGLKVEIEQVKSRIHALELENSKIALDLKHKDVIIYEKESIIKEKSEKVASLQNDLASSQGKGTSNADEKVAKAEARVTDLEKLVSKHEAEIAKQQKEKYDVEIRAVQAEKQSNELSYKLQELQKTFDLMQVKSEKIDRALRAAEHEIAKTKSEADSKIEELLKAQGGWLPPWLAAHFLRYQAHWDQHGKPAIDLAFQKASEKKAEALKWAEPHLEFVKTTRILCHSVIGLLKRQIHNDKWVPAIKEYWLLIVAHVELHVKSIKAKSIEAFEASNKAFTPHLIKLHKHVDPYYQEAKKVMRPYIEHVASVSKPHVEKVKLALKPYTEEAVKIYGRFLESASIYHSQVQVHVQETLNKHEWTKPFATKEFEWFAASAVLALPVMILFRVFSSVCSKKTKRPAKHAHGRRKTKRGHSS